MATVSNMCVRSVLRISNWSYLQASKQISKRTRLWSSTATGTETSEAASSKQSPAENKENSEQSPNDTKLTEENKKLNEELKSFKDKYVRALAETENVRTRMTKQINDAKQFGIQGFCKDLLEVADVLNAAVDSVPKEQLTENIHLKNLFEGLTMTEAQLQKVFVKHGLEKINPQVGDKFDPFIHEAMFQVPTEDKEANANVAVVNKIGYKLKERTLRPAIVGVFKS